jgi:hypothetical protein
VEGKGLTMAGMLDLYGLLVEQTFGGVTIAIIGIAVLFGALMAFTRMSMPLMITITLSYLFISAVYYAWWSSMFVAIFIFVYFFTSVIKFFSGGGQ